MSMSPAAVGLIPTAGRAESTEEVLFYPTVGGGRQGPPTGCGGAADAAGVMVFVVFVCFVWCAARGFYLPFDT